MLLTDMSHIVFLAGIQICSCWTHGWFGLQKRVGWCLISQLPVTTGFCTRARTWVCCLFWRVQMVGQTSFSSSSSWFQYAVLLSALECKLNDFISLFFPLKVTVWTPGLQGWLGTKDPRTSSHSWWHSLELRASVCVAFAQLPDTNRGTRTAQRILKTHRLLARRPWGWQRLQVVHLMLIWLNQMH